MNVAIDLDGTADAFPRVFQSLSSALVAAGHHVYIVTGVSDPEVTQADIDAKKQYLTSLGFGPESYTSVVVVPSPHPKNKLDQIQKLNIALVIDNKKKTVKDAAPNAVSLLLFNSKEK